MLLGLRGTPVLYQGDEIGMGNVVVGREDLRDPLGVRYWPHYEGRDAGRTPMQWRPGPGGGFTEPGGTPWLPLGDVDSANVEDQRADPGSLLHLARDLIAFRRRRRDFRLGAYASLPSAPGVWQWRRGTRHAVILNMTGAGVTVEGHRGTVAIGTDRGREGEAVVGLLALAAFEGVIVELSGATVH
jgi:alpha-glucosidase